MSSMSKYLKQNALVQKLLRDSSGDPQLDQYGQPAYAAAVKINCRKEPYKARGYTSYGQYVDYRTTYYFDERVPVLTGDLVDGQAVQSSAEYINGLGTLVGYEVQV